MTGKGSQRKGRRGELELRDILNGKGYSVKVGDPLNYGTQPDLYGLTGIHIEAKRDERLRLYDAMSQAQYDSLKFGDGAGTVFHRKNNRPWLVTMQLSDWLALYDKAYKGGENNAR